MPDSMQEQLRKMGLVNDKKLRKAQRVKHAAEMERKAHGASADDSSVRRRRHAPKRRLATARSTKNATNRPARRRCRRRCVN